jgi:hypothetical protein
MYIYYEHLNVETECATSFIIKVYLIRTLRMYIVHLRYYLHSLCTF